MRIMGKLMEIREGEHTKLYPVREEEAIIDLPSVDPAKIKAGDKLWVETIVANDYLLSIPFKVTAEKVIAHFPSPEKPGEAREYRQCKEKPVILISHCRTCNKEIEFPPTVGEMLNEPEIKLPEKVGQYDWHTSAVMVDRFNALIDAVREIAGREK